MKDLLQNVPKWVIYSVIGVAVAAIVYYLFYSLGKNKQDRKEQKTIDEEIKEYTQQEKASYSDSWYNSVANIAFEVMNNSSISEASNTNLFMKIKDLNNRLDWLKLVKSYGVRQLLFFGFPDGSPKNLIESLSSEGLLQEVESILRKKSIAL